MPAIPAAAVGEDGPTSRLFSALIERFAELGGVDLDLPPRATHARAADPAE